VRWALGATALTAVAVASVTAARRAEPGDVGAARRPTEVGELVTVERRDLVRTTEVDGVVGHGEPRPLALVGSGTLTALPEVGQVVGFGEAVAEVDGSPVVLLQGARPAWRTLGPGVDDGEDVRQLEASLVAIGYASADELDVDDEWTSATTAAVKRMQRWSKMPVDGRLDLGEVVFAAEPLRIASVEGTPGGEPATAGIEVTGRTQVVTVALPADEGDLVTVGDTVDVELPTGEEVAATVTGIGTAEVDAEGTATIPVTLDAGELALDDGVPVTVSVAVAAAEGVTAVPAEAMLALAEGGYALELPDPSSLTGTRLVPVEVGAFADGWVEVDGDVAAGDRVVVP